MHESVTRSRVSKTSVLVVTLLAVIAWETRAQPPAQAPPELTFSPFHENGIYSVGEVAGWTVISSPAAAASSTTYTYTAKKNNQDVIKTGTIDLSASRATIEVSMNEPGMLYVQITREGGSPMTVGAAIEPRKILPAVPRPADFDQFWADKLAALAGVPIDPVLTPIETNVPGVDTLHRQTRQSGLARARLPLQAESRGQVSGARDLSVRRRLCAEHEDRDRSGGGRLAGIRRRFARHAAERGRGCGPELSQHRRDQPRDVLFLNMYLRDARAIDFVRSRPDWDGRTIVVMGTSMGGQQSLVTAALRSDLVSAVIVNEPAGADSNGDLHGRKAGYPNWTSTDPDVMRTALYFDTVNFAPRIKAPSLIALGFIDTIAPPVGIWAVLNLVPSAEPVPMVESDHNNITPEKQEAFISRSRDVLTLILNGGTFTPSPIPSRQ